MPIRFACPSCRTQFTVPDRDAGKKAGCPVCRQRVRVPVPRRLKTMLGEEVPVLVPDRGPEARPPIEHPPSAYDAWSPPEPLSYLPPPAPPQRGKAGVLAFLLVATMFLAVFGVWFVFQAARRPRRVQGPLGRVRGRLCVAAKWVREAAGRHLVRFGDGTEAWVVQRPSPQAEFVPLGWGPAMAGPATGQLPVAPELAAGAGAPAAPGQADYRNCPAGPADGGRSVGML